MVIEYSPSHFNELVEYILKNGRMVAPRGQKTLEIIGANLVCTNPLDRIVYNPGRKMNIAFSIAEWLQCMVGDDDLSFISKFNSTMKKFAFKNRVASAYGPRLVSENLNQIEACIAALSHDSFTRQAVISIFRSEDHYKWLDLPCTLTLQFLLRDGSLDCITSMRSNDAIWGLTYDMFSFSMIQEYIARRLKVNLGYYYHNVGSLHIYFERDKNLLEQVDLHKNLQHRIMNPMLISLPFRSLWNIREQVATGQGLVSDVAPDQYWRDLIYTMRLFINRKENSDLTVINDPLLRDVSEYWSK